MEIMDRCKFVPRIISHSAFEYASVCHFQVVS